MTPKIRPAAIAVLLTFNLSSGRALAQSANAAAAEGLFQEGLSLLESGRTPEACEKFVASYRLDPANGTLQNVASCHEKEGRTASAWSEWLDLAGRAARAGQGERETLARTRAAALGKELARAELRFPASSNVATIEIDGQPLSRSAWETPLPLDPGSRTVTFKAPGMTDVTTHVTITPHANVVVEVPKLVENKATAPSSAPQGAVTPPSKDSPGNSTRTIGFAAAGAGLVATGVGVFFGLRAVSQKDDAACDGAVCANQSAVDERDAAKTSATISTVGFGLGLIGLGVGTYLILSSSKTAPTAARRLVPLLGAGRLDVGYRW